MATHSSVLAWRIPGTGEPAGLPSMGSHNVPLQGRQGSRGCIPNSPGDLPNPGIEPMSPTLQADSLPSEPPGKPKNTGLCDPIDGSPAGSPVPGILQARTLEWVAISFSNA